MAMSMTGEVQLPAAKSVVWTKLNDPEVLKACIPGCQELVKEGDTAFRATAKLAIGPVKATFKGKVTLSDIDPPNGYTITGEGEGGIAGFAKGGAKVRLSDAEGGGTKLAYDVAGQCRGQDRPARLTAHRWRGEEDVGCFLRRPSPRRWTGSGRGRAERRVRRRSYGRGSCLRRATGLGPLMQKSRTKTARIGNSNFVE